MQKELEEKLKEIIQEEIKSQMSKTVRFSRNELFNVLVNAPARYVELEAYIEECFKIKNKG